MGRRISIVPQPLFVEERQGAFALDGRAGIVAGKGCEAADSAGIIHACQTLRQLLPEVVESRQPALGVSWRVPAMVIEDAPRFAWQVGQDGRRCAGYYTRDEIGNVVRYAERRNVTIIPEIEMSGAVLNETGEGPLRFGVR